MTYTLRAKFFLVFLLPFAINEVKGQSRAEQEGFAVRGGLSAGFYIGAAFEKSYLNPTITYYELIRVTRNDKLLMGFTTRLGTFYGRDLNYYTAPSRIQDIDTLHFNGLSQTCLNLGIRAELNLGRVQVGASVDLVGLTFLGRSRTGKLYSSSGRFAAKDSLDRTVQKPFQGQDAYQRASPTRFNVNLLGDHQRGMLTTEVYARVYVVSNVALKLGYQWLTTEMALLNLDQVANNARFRNRVGLLYAALTVPLNP